MKFYVISITTFNNGTNPQYGITAYDTLDAALKVYHQKFSAAINTENVHKITVEIMNGYGVLNKVEYWEEPVAENNEEVIEG